MGILQNTVSFARQHRKSLPLVICFIVPGLILIGAYIHMAFQYEKLWLFNTVVHERGKYTLIEVIFYFRHFLWEALMKIIYAFMIVGAFYYYGNPYSQESNAKVSNRVDIRICLGIGLAVFIILIAFYRTSMDVGFKDAIAGFFQYRTHELRPLNFGSHWRNHFLSNIVLYASTSLFIITYRLLFFGRWVKRRYSLLFVAALTVYIVVTVMFGFTSDPFENPSYLGHQLREVFGTDLTITMLLCTGVLIYLENKYDSGPVNDTSENRKKVFHHLIFWAIPAIISTVFLIYKVLNLDISAQIEKLGRTQGWSKLDLFAWHFFEHSLDYVFVVCFVYSIYLFTLKSAKR